MRRFCARPWEFVIAYGNGDLWACCPGWVSGTPLGNARDPGGLLAVWRGERARRFRETVLDGSWRDCLACPHLRSVQGEVHLRDVDPASWPSAPDWPRTLVLATDDACQLACPSCRSGHVSSGPAKRDQLRALNQSLLGGGVLEHLDVLTLGGSGEPTVSPPTMEVLRGLRRDGVPRLRVRLHTNALLVDDAWWAQLGPAAELVREFDVSVDAASAETYAVTRGGDWRALERNVGALAAMLRAGRLGWVQMSFVVQRANWREARSFLAWTRALGVRAHFAAVRDWGAWGGRYPREAPFIPGHPDREAVLETFSDPAFSAPGVIVDDPLRGVRLATYGGLLHVLTPEEGGLVPPPRRPLRRPAAPPSGVLEPDADFVGDPLPPVGVSSGP